MCRPALGAVHFSGIFKQRKTSMHFCRVSRSIQNSLRALAGTVVGGLVLSAFPMAAAEVDISKLPPPAQTKIDFVRDVEPILSKNCYSCHGPARQKADLRWDVKEIALKGSEHGPVIVPGKSAESRMIHLVAGLNPDAVMPQKGERLTTEQVSLLRAWIDQGANWPDGLEPKAYTEKKTHWAFKAPVKSAIPVVKNKKWVRNAIDNFILARLEKEKLHPSTEADRVTLIRRLSLDLIGLPPTIKEMDDFLADKSPNAYEKLVDRLLDSPHYGERWGRHWLDAARYADTNGYEKDLPRSIWPYRDWVINAFNQNMPFDEFTIEQMAGDLLPNATTEQKVATGFHRNSMINEEGGVDPEEFRVAAIINRVETTGKAWLGLTVNCAQCHTHKYDPISHKEYYQLLAFLNNDDEPILEVPSKEQLAKRADIKKRIAAVEDEMLVKDSELAKRQQAWEEKERANNVEWTVLDPDAYYGAVGTKFDKLADKSLLATASSPPVSTYTVRAKTDLKNISGFQLEVLTDPNLPHNGPGRTPHGNFVLTQFSVDAISADGKTTNHVTLQNASADFSQNEFSIVDAIDGKGDKKHGWAVDGGPGRLNQDRKAVFETKEYISFDGGTTLIFTMKQLFGSQHTIGRFRLSATAKPERPVKVDPLSKQLRELVSIPTGKRTPSEQREIFNFYRTIDSKCDEGNKQISKIMDEWPQADTTMVLAARQEPRETHLFKRGDFRKPAELVTPDVPAFMPPLPKDAPRNRLTFGKWLVDKKNPLTARVTMNRFWQAYFGRGIVITAEDLGTQGDKPSHPELLDWLACEFMDKGWDMKAMHRLIVQSATYRQSSKVSPELYAVDQYNRLLARGPRVRVEAEIIHDIALEAAGLLNEKIGGPSVYPPIPDGVLGLAYGSPMKWEVSKGDDQYRRALYTFWKRSAPYPGLTIFDAPNADNVCVRRVMSDTPLQALTTLNDTVFHEAAQAMAKRVWKEGGKSDRERAIYAFRLCTGRVPDATELQDLLAMLKEKTEYFENRTTEAIQVASDDPKNPPANLNLHQIAVWTLASRVLLNLDETITKE
ncbi:MAG: putative rane protein [Pedosphaera sp.]|nr:putative rane protein [Pedosphaera sp.]